MGIDLWTYINWEKDKTRPVAARFRPVAIFLGYDSTPPEQPAGTRGGKEKGDRRHLQPDRADLGWDRASFTRLLQLDLAAVSEPANSAWSLPPHWRARIGIDTLAAPQATPGGI
jgi:hypothetical protein